MGIEIKRCTVGDLHLLQKISYQTYDETFSSYNTPENMQAYLNQAFDFEKLRGELLNPESSFYMLLIDDEAAGYMKLNEQGAQSEINDPESLELERIYVASTYHGRGLGALLMDKAIEIAVQGHKKYIWLGVWERNDKALKFYEKKGFYRISEHVFLMGDDPQTDYILRKDL